MVNTTTFLDSIKAAIRAGIISDASHGAVGDDNTAPTAGDTTLGNELFRNARQEYTEGVSDVVISLFLNSLEANGESLVEVGLFDAASAGNMLQRSLVTTITKTSGLEVWIDVEEQIDVTQ